MFKATATKTGRGLFIVLEGIDRSGKSSQLKKVIEFLENNGWKALPMAFPDRCTGVGMLIDEYLKGRKTLSPECLHLLFSANRWEQQHMIESFLKSGVSIVCDRYAYSGVAYSVGAQNLDFEWCLSADKGLIRPDLIYELEADPIECSKRGTYGAEVYERLDIQKRVKEAFKLFHNYENWVVIPSPSEPGLTSEETMDIVSRKIYDHLRGFLSTAEMPGTTQLPFRKIE